jgi:hypothetical protein
VSDTIICSTKLLKLTIFYRFDAETSTDRQSAKSAQPVPECRNGRCMPDNQPFQIAGHPIAPGARATVEVPVLFVSATIHGAEVIGVETARPPAAASVTDEVTGPYAAAVTNL